MNVNRAAFLDMIGVSEGTSTSHLTQSHGYDVIVTGIDGPEIFTDYSAHPFVHRPPKIVNRNGLKSTASGKFQILISNWAYYGALLNLPDFFPESQDAIAVQLIKERGALPLIEAGSLLQAIGRCSNIWASLPGNGYGQATRSVAFLSAAYIAAGGVIGVAPEPQFWGNEVRR